MDCLSLIRTPLKFCRDCRLTFTSSCCNKNASEDGEDSLRLVHVATQTDESGWNRSTVQGSEIENPKLNQGGCEKVPSGAICLQSASADKEKVSTKKSNLHRHKRCIPDGLGGHAKVQRV